MAGNPTITGVRGTEFAYTGESTTPFAGVTITDPTPGATDTVYIGESPVSSPPLQDGTGYSGLMNQPFDAGAAHIAQYYMLQGTASQVTEELDALVLPASSSGLAYQVGINFGVTSSSGASSADTGTSIDYSSVKPNGQGIVDIESPNQTVYLAPFDIALNHHQTDTRFVFSRGGGIDVIRGFELSGTGHDTLSLPRSDFANLAAVFHNTGDVGGSAFITDPRTGDAIRLAGVTTAELKAHAKDITLYS